MRPWTIFVVGALLLGLVTIGGLLLNRRKHPEALKARRPAKDAQILYLLMWLALLSILAYIAFVFGKR